MEMFEKDKPNRMRNVVIIACLVVVVLMVIALLITKLYYTNRWFPNTSINGMDVSDMKYEEAVKEFQNKIDNYTLRVSGRDGAVLEISSSAIDLKADVLNTLKKIYDEEHDGFFIFNFTKHEYEQSFEVSYDEENLEQLLFTSALVRGDSSFQIKKPKNAYVNYSEETGYGEIVPEEPGNTIIKSELSKIVAESLSCMKDKLDLTEEEYTDVYKKPKYTSEDEKIKEEQRVYNTYLLNWVSWDMGEGVTETIGPEEIKDWLSISKKGKVKFNKTAMSEWVENFCLKYKTEGTTREFTTHDKKKIKVEGGDYGWRMDYEETVKQAYNAIKKNNNSESIQAYIENPSDSNKEKLTTKLEPEFTNTGFKKDYNNFSNDWDMKNYSEVDLTNQMVYVYKDGKQVYSAICVTGLDSDPERRTRTGCYYIKDKKEEYVLTGADYSTPTKYWVRIMWTGTGYHYLGRSDWGRWSPEIYKTRGSHGCINLQLNDAKNIYNSVKMRDAVFIHY